MNYFLLVNTLSNSGKSRLLIQKKLDLIKHYLPDSEIRYVKEGESIEEIISTISDRFDVVVAGGGDGTVNSVASSIRNHNIYLGILPIGTGNDFSKSLGLNKSFEENLKILEKGDSKSIDLVQVNDTFFINTLGIGFDGETNFIANKLPGWLLDFRYMIAGLSVLKSAKRFKAIINHDPHSEALTIDTKMIVAANGKWEGSKYLISPSSEVNDGVFELVYAKDVSTFWLVIEFMKLSLGFPVSSKLFETIRAKEFSIETSTPVYVHKDGEFLEMQNQFDLKLFPNQIKVIG